MNILDIYKKYQIMPQLQEHQLRVAGVADFICDHLNLLPNPPHKGEGIISLDRDNIVVACLLHDVGNIVKFDLEKTKDLFTGDFKNPGDLLFWENVKRKFLGKYGTGSHNVTAKIVGELGVSERIRELVDCVGFEQAADNAETGDFGKKICAYSDMRVMPMGVVSLEERIVDLRVRYKNHPEGGKNRDMFEIALREIERQIFGHCDIKPEDIIEAAIEGRKEKLQNFEI